jgi:hypothetical protein
VGRKYVGQIDSLKKRALEALPAVVGGEEPQREA